MKTKLLLFAALACSIAIMANESKQDLAQRRATVEQLNEENPNNCVVVGAMFFQNDTVPTEKSDYYYDKDKVTSVVIDDAEIALRLVESRLVRSADAVADKVRPLVESEL